MLWTDVLPLLWILADLEKDLRSELMLPLLSVLRSKINNMITA